MLVAVWSVKGGVGTTVVAVGAAVAGSRREAPALLVDLAGDVPACLGIDEPTGPGVAEWLAAGGDVPPDALARLQVPVLPGLDLLPWGSGTLAVDRAPLLVQVLSASRRTVVVDGGDPTLAGSSRLVVAEADRSLLVTRLCPLGLRRAASAPVLPSGVVVVRETGRTTPVAEVARTVGAPVVAEVAVDPAVARAVDVGLARRRLPRSFATAVGSVAA
jgi:MinD superfamily P-loop ATPase